MLLCIGEILADMIGEEKNGTITYERKAGGAPFNVACALKKFGSEVKFVGSVGDDLIGDFLIKYAKDFGMDTTYIHQNPERNTTLAFVELNEEGERSFCFYRKNTADYRMPAVSDELIKSADIVCIGSLMLADADCVEYALDIAERAHALGKTVAFDVPSGAECDNGQVSANCVKAAFTLAFIACKPCHFLYPSAEYCGKVIEVNLNLAEKSYVDQTIFLVTDNTVKPVVGNKRPKDCHKYDFGRALLICGSYGMAGAAKLAATAAINGTGNAGALPAAAIKNALLQIFMEPTPNTPIRPYATA